MQSNKETLKPSLSDALSVTVIIKGTGILKEGVCVSFRSNALGKSMNPSIFPQQQ